MQTTRVTRVEWAYAELRREILCCQIMPGARVNISECALRLSVSTGAVREALSRLAAQKLVVLEPLKGFRAEQISCRASGQIMEAHAEVESVCLRLSMTRGDSAWRSALAQSFEALCAASVASDDEEASASERAHSAFHHALVAGCGNDTILELRSELLERSQRVYGLARQLAPHAQVDSEDHRAIFEAALSGDLDRGAAEMRATIMKTRQIILDAMDSPEWVAWVASQTPLKLAVSTTGEGPSHRLRQSAQA